MRLIHVVRAAVAVAAVAVAVFAFAGPASAHVTVNPNTATQGGYTKLTFRVPNEKANASTVALEVNLPPAAPIRSVSVKPVAGWTAQVENAKLAVPVKGEGGQDITEAVSKITWTAAADAAIKPGQFQEFEISAGPLPAVDQIVFKALQTYSDGDIVRWIDEPAPGVEADHPAPVLKLTKGTGDSHGDPADDSADMATDTGGSSGAALGFGIAGAVLGVAALAVALLAYRRASPPTA